MAASFDVKTDLNMNTHKITNVVDPTNDQDAATKKYVDDNAGSGGAPADATYITQTANGGLSAEQALSALSTGLVKVTTTTGVLSTATPNSDYVSDIGVVTHAATGKTTPVDADEMPISDSAASNVLKKVSLTNLKAFLKTYFDTLYASVSGSAPIGTPELIYRYTVTGSDKASIDTGSDTPDAGSNDWTNGDLLEVYLYARTDETTQRSDLDVTFNNDATTTHYFTDYIRSVNVTISTIRASAVAGWQPVCPAASFTASVFGVITVQIPNYSGSVGFHNGTFQCSIVDGTTNDSVNSGGFIWNQASGITRLAVTPHTSGKKLKVGSQLLIYKRRSA